MSVESRNLDDITSELVGKHQLDFEGPIPPSFLTVGDIAYELQVGEATVRALLDAGAMPYVRTSSRETRVHRQSFEDWRFSEEMNNFTPADRGACQKPRPAE